MNDQKILEILNNSKCIAIVGLSDNPERSSYGVAEYLSRYYEIVGINPQIKSWKGKPVYSSLVEVPESQTLDIVNIFRRSEFVSEIVDQVIQRGRVRCIWMQLGVIDTQAARRAENAGIEVVMDECLAVAHNRLK